jgi:lipid-A-disaccharide synthase
VLRSLGFYLSLVRRTARVFHDEPFDLFVPVDSPALHAPLGRIARACGVPCMHYVTPQLWGWAPWRAAGYARAVDLALTILPFEPAWFAARGVRCAHVGHPQRDALATPAARGHAGAREQPAASEPLLVLLPGSRAGVVARNLPWMLSAAARLRLELPELAVAIGAAAGPSRAHVREAVARAGAGGWARIEEGPLHPLLARARVALSVSGTVLVDLLERRVPAVVIYRLGGPLAARLAPHALSVPWFSSVNLLANREVYREFTFHGAGPLEEVCAELVLCYKDPDRRRAVREGLELAARSLGPPGAARRAALQALQLLAGRAGT